MGNYQSTYMLELFPNQNSIGIDLGNVEIKECTNKRQQFTINKKNQNGHDAVLGHRMYDEIEAIATFQMYAKGYQT